MGTLISKKRCDAGFPRVISNDAIAKINDLKVKYPYITVALVYQKLVEEGYINKGSTFLFDY